MDGVTLTAYRDDYEYNLGQNVYFVIKNTTNETVISRIFIEQLQGDEWTRPDYNSFPSYLPGADPFESVQEDVIFFTGDGGELTQKGTYRFRVEVEGGETFYSKNFTLV